MRKHVKLRKRSCGPSSESGQYRSFCRGKGLSVSREIRIFLWSSNALNKKRPFRLRKKREHVAGNRDHARCGETCHCGWERPAMWSKIVTWLILPVVICLSQRLSHACLSINNFVLWNCEWLIKSVIVYLIIPYYLDNRGNSRANTCNKSRLLEGMYLLDKKPTRSRFFGDSW